ncbi:MAG: hypothetical protein ACI8SR_001601 [Oceanicoccus sp.]|jgi:hypothetical protein
MNTISKRRFHNMPVQFKLSRDLKNTVQGSYMVTKFVQFLCLILLSQLSWAVDPIVGSEQKSSGTIQYKDHRLVLGAIQRISGAMKPEAEVRLSGKVRHWLWQLPEGLSSDEAFAFFKNQLSTKVSTLFQCEGRSCGLSNDFANQVFNQSILYGRDSDQFYWVGLSDDKSPSVWLVYTSARSAKRVYAYVEKIELDRGQIDKLDGFVQKGQAQTLFDQGYIVMSQIGTEARLRDAQVDWLKQLLLENPNKRFALVVHRYGGVENQTLIENTQKEANKLLDQVANAGGFIKNLYAHGAGAVMPRALKSDRIELVELKK